MSSPEAQASSSYNSPPVTVVLAVIILVFFFFGFFSVYLCRCVMGSALRAWHFRRAPPSGVGVGVLPGAGAGAGASQGLDPSHIEAFPSFKYSSVKDLRPDKHALDCAICLSDFHPDSLLRLLTLCYHVFHQECIDLWLHSHNTCPVCRRILLDPPKNNSPHPHHHHAIDIDIDLPDDHHQDHHDHDQDQDHDEEQQEGSDRGGGQIGLSRSNTTGHSVVARSTREEEEEDRYTLRLPEHVKIRLLRGHNWTGSCTTFDDISKNKASGRFCGGDGTTT